MEDVRDTEHDGRCLECGAALDSRRNDAKWCSDAHRKRYARRESRKEAQRQKYLSGHPDVPLDDFYALLEPGTWDNEDQDHEPGNSWDDMWKLQEAIDAVEGRYERLMKPYAAQQRRNAGVRLSGLVALERERDREIDAMIRAHELADELGRASRDEPRRINEAHERQREGVALQALGNARPSRARYEGRTQTPNIGRATRDVWRW
jgi:hypothetical protein